MTGPRLDRTQQATPSRERNLPVTDAERDHISEILQRAVGRGTLTLGEFTDRMDAALAATTRAELNAVVIDIPGIRMVNPQAGVATAASNGDAGVGNRNSSSSGWFVPSLSGGGVRAELRAGMAGLTRTGPWRVPEVLRLHSRFSHVDLDFTEAEAQTQIVELVVDDICSTVTLIVPRDVTVDVSRLSCINGSTVTNDAYPGPPPGRLHLAIIGRLRFGTMTVRVA